MPAEQGSFERHATLLLLAQAGGSDGGVLDLDMAASTMTQIGWGIVDHDTVPDWIFFRLPAYDVLANVSDHPRRMSDERERVSPVAAALARAASRR